METQTWQHLNQVNVLLDALDRAISETKTAHQQALDAIEARKSKLEDETDQLRGDAGTKRNEYQKCLMQMRENWPSVQESQATQIKRESSLLALQQELETVVQTIDVLRQVVE